jgi:pilus assembly protein Flp/PilA
MFWIEGSTLPGLIRVEQLTQPKGEPEMLNTFEFVAAWMRAKVNTERGASLVEYALLLALIAVVCIVAITALGDKASENFDSISDSL